MREDSDRTSFTIDHEGEPSKTLLVGLPEIGMAGLTAVQYLNEELEFEVSGHVENEELPSITPFEEGVPRHHTRFFSSPDYDFTTLVGELPVPIWASRSLSDAVLDWTEENGVEEVVFLSGVAMPHDPDEHEVFYVATDDYRENRLKDADVKPMSGGFLEGVNAEVVQRGIGSPLTVGIYATPVHPLPQDVEAAIRLISGFRNVYDVDVDVAPLEEYAKKLDDYHLQLFEHMREQKEGGRPAEDRMFM